MISNKPGMNPQPGNHNFREKHLLFNGPGLMIEPQKTNMPRGTASQGQYGLRTKTASGSKPGQDFSKKPLQKPDDVEEQVAWPIPYNPPQR